MARLPDGEKISKISLLIGATQERDRQTDGRTDGHCIPAIAAPRLCIASSGKNQVHLVTQVHLVMQIHLVTQVYLVTHVHLEMVSKWHVFYSYHYRHLVSSVHCAVPAVGLLLTTE